MQSNTQTRLESTSSGHCDFNIKTILTEAWQKTTGLKGRYWAALITILVITFATSFVAFAIDNMIEGTTSAEAAAAPRALIQLIEMVFSIFLITPLFAGLIMMCIKHCTGESVPFSSIFNYIKYWKQLWIYPVAMTVLALIKNYFLDYDSIQLVIFLIMLFISVTYVLFIPLVVEKNLPQWTALETSRKTTFHHWFKVLGLLLILGLIFLGSLLTLGIALIWTLPMLYNAIAILYRTLFMPTLG